MDINFVLDFYTSEKSDKSAEFLRVVHEFLMEEISKYNKSGLVMNCSFSATQQSAVRASMASIKRKQYSRDKKKASIPTLQQENDVFQKFVFVSNQENFDVLTSLISRLTFASYTDLLCLEQAESVKKILRACLLTTKVAAVLNTSPSYMFQLGYDKALEDRQTKAGSKSPKAVEELNRAIIDFISLKLPKMWPSEEDKIKYQLPKKLPLKHPTKEIAALCLSDSDLQNKYKTVFPKRAESSNIDDYIREQLKNTTSRFRVLLDQQLRIPSPILTHILKS